MRTTIKSAHQNEGGRIRLWVIILIVLIPIVLYGLYKIVPIAWHGFFALLSNIRIWWHVQFADPILVWLLYVLEATQRQPVIALAIIALGHWIIIRINRIISSFGFRKAVRQQGTAQENLITQMESVQGKLKRMFSDDVEKIALFGGKMTEDHKEATIINPVSLQCLGCLPSLIWGLISAPIMFMFGLAVYDGVLRVFVTQESAASLLAPGDSRLSQLQTLVPVADTAVLPGGIAVKLAERSLTLTAILFVIILAGWLVNNISISGWTFPRFHNLSPVVGNILLAIICYLFLNSALLIFTISWTSYSLIYLVLTKFLLRRPYLRLRAAIVPLVRKRKRPRVHSVPAEA